MMISLQYREHEMQEAETDNHYYLATETKVNNEQYFEQDKVYFLLIGNQRLMTKCSLM